MSGSGGLRGDGDYGGGGLGGGGGGGFGGGGGQPDPCLATRQGTINSPNPVVLTTLAVGAILDVWVDTAGSRPVLVVGPGGQAAGTLTFRGYLDLIDCIINRGINYRAIITNIAGGMHEVRVEPV